MLPPIHPICRLFPMLPEAELEGMAEDIRRRGRLLEPIVLLKGAVLDGQNRLEACRRAGVPPTFVTWEGEGSPLEWAIAKNLHRRQLSASQRAVIALQVLPLLEREAKERQRQFATPDRRVAHFCANPPQEGDNGRGKAVEHAARLLNASPRYIQAAKRIDRMCPDLLPHVMSGKINMIDAQQAANLSPGIRSDVLEKLSQAPPGLATDARRMIRGHAGVMPLGRVGQEYRVVLTDDQLGALDDGEEIVITLADRSCRARLAERPEGQEANPSRQTTIARELASAPPIRRPVAPAVPSGTPKNSKQEC